MDLELTDDQRLFQETARKFLETEMPLARVRQLAEDPAGFERPWWRRAAELGWTALCVPESLGGGTVSGSGVRDLAIVAEEMGRLVAPGPFLATNVVAYAVARSGTPEQQAAILPGIATGDTVAAWCFSGPPSRRHFDGIGVRATAHGGGFMLEGRATKVEAAGEADQLLVSAQTQQGHTQFLVPPRTQGIHVTPLEGLDLVRRFGDVEFRKVEVPGSAVVGTVDKAADDLERQLRVALVLQCAEMVGAAGRVFDFTLEYAFDRYTFGRPLASYQALKHRFADMRLWLEASYATTVGATRAVAEDRPDASPHAGIAKAYVAVHVPELIQDCIQLHGGIALTWEHDIHLYLRRVTVDRGMYGAPGDHFERVGAALVEGGDQR